MRIRCYENTAQSSDEVNITIHPNARQYVDYILKQVSLEAIRVPVCDIRNIRTHLIVSDIYYIEAIERKLYVYTYNNDYRLLWNMKKARDVLTDCGFVKINAKTYVNRIHIKSCLVLDSCKRQLVLDNNEELIVSRTFKDQFNT